jgi:hypothetical protein
MQINVNNLFDVYCKKITTYGLSVDEAKMLIQSIGADRIKNAPFMMDNKYNVSTQGSMLLVVLHLLTTTAYYLYNNTYKQIMPNISDVVNESSLYKVCLLQHLAKAVMFEPDKYPYQYRFAESQTSLKLGSRSLSLLTNCGIKLTETEVEALTIIDVDEIASSKNFYISTLAKMVKQVNDITNIAIKNGYFKDNK